MTVKTDINYIEGLKALKNKDYEGALEYLKMSEKEFAENRDLRILSETVELLLAVRNDIALSSVTENSKELI